MVDEDIEGISFLVLIMTALTGLDSGEVIIIVLVTYIGTRITAYCTAAVEKSVERIKKLMLKHYVLLKNNEGFKFILYYKCIHVNVYIIFPIDICG